MKTQILFLIIIASHCTWAQPFMVNKNGRYHQSEVVVVEGFTGSTLFENGLQWIKTPGHIAGRVFEIKSDSIAQSVSAKMEIKTFTQSGVFKKQTGTITYHFRMEMKDGKYRYMFSDFVFHYYAADRNLKLVDTQKTKRLEDKKAQGWQRTWNDHKQFAYETVKNQIESFSHALTAKPVIMEPIAKKETEW